MSEPQEEMTPNVQPPIHGLNIGKSHFAVSVRAFGEGGLRAAPTRHVVTPGST